LFFDLVVHFEIERGQQRMPFDLERQRMVEYQLQNRGIKDARVLEAMLKVERHLFVEPGYEDFAYQDLPFPIGYEQTISQPYMVAFMTESLGLTKNDRVLEVGTGSGYQAAILAEIAKEVYSVELIEPLALSAAERLEKLGYRNVHVQCGDGHQGWPEHAPYDAVIVTAAPSKIPKALVEQMKTGGRMVIPLGSFFQNLYFVKKTPHGIEKEELFPVRFVPMVFPKEMASDKKN
jgi:protein-L-isoaspartate(D-aspartate) O-methyltransferase